MSKAGILSLLPILAVLLVGCGGATTGAAGEATAIVAAQGPTALPSPTPVVGQAAEGAGLAKPVLASSELVVGPERFVFGLVDAASGRPVTNVPGVDLQFFKVHENGTATKVGDANPIYRSENLPAGVFVARTTFDAPGKWGALITVHPPAQAPYGVKLDFEVIKHGSVPVPGDPAPPSENDTTKTQSIDLICSGVPHDDMHSMTIAEAVKSGKPTLVLFAAPGYCPTFTCGPDLQLAEAIEAKYRDKANYIHIETPNEISSHTHAGALDKHHEDEPGHRGIWRPQIETSNQWGLKTEPWIFLVDKNGKIFERFEGGLTLDEVLPEFEKMLAQP